MKTTFRIDEPGSFHHVLSRAIDGRDIFSLPDNQKDFICRLERLVEKEHLKIHAWVLMSNHFHLLAEPCKSSLSKCMQILLTGFAMYFNKRSERQGHVFQSRFKSILVEKEAYLLELVRYIHLNPLRAGVIKNLANLDKYISSGHVHITGVCNYPWQDTELLESEFSGGDQSWISNYMNFLSDGSHCDKSALSNGTYVIDRKGLTEVENDRITIPPRSVRIAGSKEYAKTIYRALYGVRKIKIRNRSHEHKEIEKVILTASEISGISIDILRKSGGTRTATRVRRILAKILVNVYGLQQADAARYLGISEPSVSRFLNERLDPSSIILMKSIKRSK